MRKSFMQPDQAPTKQTIEGATYKTKSVKVLGNIFTIMEVTGRFNHITVIKETNNPFKGLGNDFLNWDTATRHYKSPEMKTALLMAEIEFKNL